MTRPSETLTIRTLHPDGGAPDGERTIAVETPVAVSFFGIGYAVMMATPADLEDFAVGFALSERLIEGIGDVAGIEVRDAQTGLLLEVELHQDRRDLVFQRVRHRIGESSCGLCGIENLEQALRPLPRAAPPPDIAPEAVFAALAQLSKYQPLNRATGAVHAAAAVAPSGDILAVREDVGRHNAFDKLVGHCLRDGIAMSSAFALLTSRCSYELVEKAALAGFGMLVTVSAPTTLAAERARDAGLTLIALARSDAMILVSDPHRLFDGGPVQRSR